MTIDDPYRTLTRKYEFLYEENIGIHQEMNNFLKTNYGETREEMSSSAFDSKSMCNDV